MMLFMPRRLRIGLSLLALLLGPAVPLAAQTVFPSPDWEVAKPETQAVSSVALERVGQWLKDSGAKAGLVVRHGRIVGEWYFDDATPDSKYLIYSTTKSLSGIAAGLAIGAGKLTLDSTVGDFFPEAHPPQKREITVRHLLSMTSGAHSDNSILKRDDLFSYVLGELPMDFRPGEKWEYNNSGLSLLGPVIHKATGQQIDRLLDEQVFQKIGIRPEDWSWDKRGETPIPYSGLHLTARALARFGLLALNKGQWHGSKVFSSDWMNESVRPSQETTPMYGYLWWTNRVGGWSKVPRDAFATMGKFGNSMLVVPSLDMIVLRLIGDDSAQNRNPPMEELFTLAVAAVTDPSPSLAVAETPSDLEVQKVFTNFRIDRPILLTHAGDGTNRLFVPSQKGTIYVFPNDAAVEEPQVFLDISSRVVYEDKQNEKGFLGLAFHPKYRENGQFFVYYTPTGTRKPHTIAVSRFRVSKDDPNRADPDSEERLLEVEHPFWNHKGGTVVFGPDGYLYIAIGDGGLANDPYKNGQNLGTLLGKILRIDVDRRDGDQPYAIPPDNPFVGQPGNAPEIYAYGMRNPWRIAFDRETGTLWCGDVGQDLWEEIDLIVKGGNYGWNLREGFHKFGLKGADPRPDLIEPIWEYHHDIGKSITGGHVYRGKKFPQLAGCYLFADYVAGQVWALKYDKAQKKVDAVYTIHGNIMPIISFGEDEQGEAYYTTDTGSIFTFRKMASESAAGGQ
jgi:CubicO group peptidase (beta-lactamase class C family)